MTGHLDIEQLESMGKTNLQALAKELGVSAKGTIKEIAARCAEVEVEVDTPEEADAAAAENAATAPDEAEQEAAVEEQATADTVKVKAVVRFKDKQLKTIKKAGEEYSVSKERAAQLVAAKVAEIVE